MKVINKKLGTTYQCVVCGALWRLNPAEPNKYPPEHPFHNETWSLISKQCGKCCDNVAMGKQIKEIV